VVDEETRSDRKRLWIKVAALVIESSVGFGLKESSGRIGRSEIKQCLILLNTRNPKQKLIIIEIVGVRSAREISQRATKVRDDRIRKREEIIPLVNGINIGCLRNRSGNRNGQRPRIATIVYERGSTGRQWGIVIITTLVIKSIKRFRLKESSGCIGCSEIKQRLILLDAKIPKQDLRIGLVVRIRNQT